MRIAIYSRKSKFTGKGDSIDNQIQMCREYITKHFPNADDIRVDVYEDEGYSGKNLDRPKFKEFISVEKVNPYNYLIVYRLDRVSRNVRDFANLYKELSDYGTQFICIQGSYDTSTPQGRAMMEMSAVFAELERSIIAERIRDNMQLMAQGGKFLGGTYPLGYHSVANTRIDTNGKEQTYHTLEMNDDIQIVKLVYQKYSELQSVNAVENYLNSIKQKTRNGYDWNKSNVKRILENPVYCIADKDSLEYFQSIGCNVYFSADECDGQSGILAYNRHRNGKNTPPDKWLISISTHEGVFTGREWVRIQNLLKANSTNAFGGSPVTRRTLNPYSILSGVLKCKCGAYMRPKMYQSGSMFYICERKEKTNGIECDVANVNGDALDAQIKDTLFTYSEDGSEVNQHLRKLNTRLKSIDEDINQQTKKLESEKKALLKKQEQIIERLSEFTMPNAISVVEQQLEKYQAEIATIDDKISALQNRGEIKQGLQSSFNDIKQALAYLKDNFDVLTIELRREYIRRIIEKVEWNGEEVHLFYKGSNEE